MGLTGKLEGHTEIKSSPQVFHDLFAGKPHQIAIASPEIVHGHTLHEGELGATGSIIEFHFTHDGVRKSTKNLIEKDDGKNQLVLKVVGGDFDEEFTNLRGTYVATEKGDGKSIVKWTLEFEKKNETVADPVSVLQFLIDVTNNVDAHLQEAASKVAP
uniref:Bet v I/Major latex protein domain-containing protein n=1 Tax=Kalanchoe fedtschenkoi TaxID=63787 RepID=A0A7N0ZT72_KALFE